MARQHCHGPTRHRQVRPAAGPPPEGAASGHAGRLFRLVKDLQVPVGFERSFKLSAQTLLSDRFLLGAAMGGALQRRQSDLIAVCRRLQMPKPFLTMFQANLSAADYVHFGFERGARSAVFKVYQEFFEQIARRGRSPETAREPRLLHLGYKWDVSDRRRRALTRYMWTPAVTPAGVMRRVAEMLEAPARRGLFSLVRGMLSLALTRMPPDDLLFLDVSEQNSPRRSFDLNLYGAGLCLAELYPFLHQLCRIYRIRLSAFHRLYDGIRSLTVGHLSGGIDRAGTDFLTVYYGVESLSRSEGAAAPDEKKARPVAPAGRRHEGAGRLIEQVKRLQAPVALEHSFKLSPERFLPDRFLAGVKTADLGPDAQERLLSVCRDLQMPEAHLSRFDRYLSEATIVLFGFEQGRKGAVLKVYLEFGGRLKNRVSALRGQSAGIVIHVGLKWDPDEPSRRTVATYRCFPQYRVDDMLAAVKSRHYGPGQSEALLITEGIVRLCASRVGADRFLYFEAEEEGNPRASFDINLYRADVALCELYPVLIRMCRYYAIPLGRFHDHYAPVKHLHVGHLTGGRDRQGRPFHTVYFGVKGRAG